MTKHLTHYDVQGVGPTWAPKPGDWLGKPKSPFSARTTMDSPNVVPGSEGCYAHLHVRIKTLTISTP